MSTGCENAGQQRPEHLQQLHTLPAPRTSFTDKQQPKHLEPLHTMHSQAAASRGVDTLTKRKLTCSCSPVALTIPLLPAIPPLHHDLASTHFRSVEDAAGAGAAGEYAGEQICAEVLIVVAHHLEVMLDACSDGIGAQYLCSE
mmetsp:Transcript_68248/g.142205  ORF Transcript_68248/g.142205 Transcript_68248/m.142205 type:complete len:143 (+) Transcript_68248:369-797(+)